MLQTILKYCIAVALAVGFVETVDELLVGWNSIDTSSADYYRSEIQNEITTALGRPDLVQFHCVRPGSQTFVQLFSTDENERFSKHFDLSLPWSFVIHGWMEGFNKSVLEINGKDWAKFGNTNVCGVDWSLLADHINYVKVALVNTHIAAELLLQFIRALVRAGISTNNIKIAGHSLGSHVAGFTGKLIKQYSLPIAIIWGLDPAGILFDFPLAPPNKRLDSTDAAYVEVIHTSAFTYGAHICLGDADYWANDGKLQPSCSLSLLRNFKIDLQLPFLCSHLRAVEYFFYALNPANRFLGHHCAHGCKDMPSNLSSCSASQTSLFGIHTSKNRGFFALKTGHDAPFALN